MHEKISALLDNELDRHEQDQVLKSISQDDELAVVWERYHLIQAAVRNEPIVHIPALAVRVEAVLSQAKEPEASAPHRVATPGGLKWMPGLAVAASIAILVAIGLIGGFSNQHSPQIAKQNQIAQVEQATKWETTTPELEQALNTFLVEHGEFTPMSSMNGLMAYAKFVSYDSAR